MQVITFKTKKVEKIPVTNKETGLQDEVDVLFENEHTIDINEIKGWIVQTVTAPLKDEENPEVPKMQTETNLVITLKDKVIDYQLAKVPTIVKNQKQSQIVEKEQIVQVEVNRLITLQGEEMDSVLTQLESFKAK